MGQASATGGLSNSLLRSTSETPQSRDLTTCSLTAGDLITIPSVVESGIDTWRLSRYLDDEKDLLRAKSLCPGGVSSEKANGHRWGVIPAYRMLWAEGHPAPGGLASLGGLAAAEDQLLAALADSGAPIGRDGGVGRLDQTVTLSFARGSEGLAFLEGLAVADVPRVKPAVYGRPGMRETVYLLGGQSGRVLARAYDKGYESGAAPRGRLIRLENQTRFTKEARMKAKVHADNPQVAAKLFKDRFAPVAVSVDGLHAASAPVIAERLREMVKDGAVTHRQAERMAGFLVLGGEAFPRTTVWRRRRELRLQGLVLVDPLTDPVDVDMGAALDAALAAWSAS
jgi:hypothetical protein